MVEPLLIAQSKDGPLYLLPPMANRHGLVAGATGTGKTVTLQVMAEAFSRIGVPVFAADVKGDLSGISQPGAANPKLDARIKQLKLAGFQFSANPASRSPRQAAPGGPTPTSPASWLPNLGTILGGSTGRRGDSLAEAAMKSAARAMGSSVGRQIVRGVLGSLLGSSRR